MRIGTVLIALLALAAGAPYAGAQTAGAAPPSFEEASRLLVRLNSEGGNALVIYRTVAQPTIRIGRYAFGTYDSWCTFRTMAGRSCIARDVSPAQYALLQALASRQGEVQRATARLKNWFEARAFLNMGYEGYTLSIAVGSEFSPSVYPIAQGTYDQPLDPAALDRLLFRLDMMAAEMLDH